jgi:hypothetical protein
MDLAGIRWLRGLDKIPGRTRFCTVLGANRTHYGRKQLELRFNFCRLLACASRWSIREYVGHS